MIRFLIRKRILDYEDVRNPEVRKRYGVLGGSLGLLCNALLFLIKLFSGITTNSLAVISDAFNNLSDMGASAVSVIGAKLSSRKADTGHPYGHGRGEYISALMVAFLIILVGVELLKNSIAEIISPKPVVMNSLSLILLLISILIKLWMWSYNRYMGKAIDSGVLLATAKDSINDVIATSTVVLSAALSPFLEFPVDGVISTAVSLLVLWSGFSVAKDTIDTLLGRNPEENLREQIEAMVLESDMVIGMHDLMVHDYGPGRIIASVHAEVPASLSLIDCHEVIDKIEKRILEELNVDIVIHMDPISFIS